MYMVTCLELSGNTNNMSAGSCAVCDSFLQQVSMAVMRAFPRPQFCRLSSCSLTLFRHVLSNTPYVILCSYVCCGMRPALLLRMHVCTAKVLWHMSCSLNDTSLCQPMCTFGVAMVALPEAKQLVDNKVMQLHVPLVCHAQGSVWSETCNGTAD